jgi:membrane-associated PAP2 superfamily phosphatase
MQITKLITILSISLICSVLLFGIIDIDIYIQDLFFDFDTKNWVLNRDLQPWKFLFYDGIKKLLIFIGIIFLITFIFFRNHDKIKKYKKGILVVILSAILVPVVVGGLKKSTNMPCPKNTIHYGGMMLNTAVWQKYPQPYHDMPKIACWPAGHASGGFALMSLFFFFKSRKNQNLALVFGLLTGWAMGIYKMLIGDHFLSHTVITMLISIIMILLIKILTDKFYKEQYEKST